MSQENLSQPVEQLSFEEALKELETIVKKLEAGHGTLEAAIQYYERGNSLKAHCEKKLREARLKVDKIIKDANGALQAVPEREENS
jgi:exodeoxyribonuclease VII small subunit